MIELPKNPDLAKYKPYSVDYFENDDIVARVRTYYPRTKRTEQLPYIVHEVAGGKNVHWVVPRNYRGPAMTSDLDVVKYSLEPKNYDKFCAIVETEFSNFNYGYAKNLSDALIRMFRNCDREYVTKLLFERVGEDMGSALVDTDCEIVHEVMARYLFNSVNRRQYPSIAEMLCDFSDKGGREDLIKGLITRLGLDLFLYRNAKTLGIKCVETGNNELLVGVDKGLLKLAKKNGINSSKGPFIELHLDMVDKHKLHDTYDKRVVVYQDADIILARKSQSDQGAKGLDFDNIGKSRSERRVIRVPVSELPSFSGKCLSINSKTQKELRSTYESTGGNLTRIGSNFYRYCQNAFDKAASAYLFYQH